MTRRASGRRAAAAAGCAPSEPPRRDADPAPDAVRRARREASVRGQPAAHPARVVHSLCDRAVDSWITGLTRSPRPLVSGIRTEPTWVTGSRGARGNPAANRTSHGRPGIEGRCDVRRRRERSPDGPHRHDRQEGCLDRPRDPLPTRVDRCPPLPPAYDHALDSGLAAARDRAVGGTRARPSTGTSGCSSPGTPRST